MASCTHLDQIEVTELPESVDGCEECLKSGDPWLHLRICLECGEVGCCDSSPNRHASRHARRHADTALPAGRLSADQRRPARLHAVLTGPAAGPRLCLCASVRLEQDPVSSKD